MSKNNTFETDASRRNVLQSIAATGATAVGLSSAGVAGASSVGDVTTFGSVNAGVESTRTVEIKADGRASYEFSVTGVLSAADAPADSLDRGTAAATVDGDVHAFSFSGEFTSFDVSGEATVLVDGDEFDSATFPHETLRIVPRGEISYDVSASGAVEVESGEADRPTDRRATGTARRVQEIAYAGELTYVDIDGEAHLFKNGTKVDAESVLPSTHPGRLTVRAPNGGNRPYAIEINGAASPQGERSPNVDVDGGRVHGRADASETTLRYSGQVDVVEHSGVGTVTINRQARRVECTAAGSGKVTFELRSSEGIRYDGSIEETKTVVVAGGENESIQYFDNITAVAIDGLEVGLAPDRYRSETDVSERLQLAAKIEREQAFRTLERAAQEHGRVRRDAGGIVASSVTNPTSDSVRPRFVVGFEITDLVKGDEAMLSLGKVVRTGAVLDPTLTYEWKQGNFTRKLEFHQISSETGASIAADGPGAMESEVVEYDIDAYRQAHGDANSVATVPAGEEVTARDFQTSGDVHATGDWIGAIIDGVSDLADAIAGITKDALNRAIEEAIEVTNVSKEDFVIKSGKLVANSAIAAQAIATEFMERGWLKALWKIRIKGLSTLVSLANTGILQDLTDDGEVSSCNQCVAVVRILVDVGICGYGSAYVCTTLGIATASVGGIACAVFVGTICNSVLNDVEDVKTLCGEGSSSYPQGNWC